MEVDSKDVVRLLLQYLKESNLKASLQALQTESGVALNTVDDCDAFLGDVRAGRWDAVVAQLACCSVPTGKLVDVYEQIINELVVNGEKELAREMLRRTPCLNGHLRDTDAERYLKLEYYCQKASVREADLYPVGYTKERRRGEIALSLAAEVESVPRSRLLAIINQALHYQQERGLLPADSSYDLLMGGGRAEKKDEEECVVHKQVGIIKFGAANHPETAIFSPDGRSLVTGSVDGFVEVWEHASCKLREDLEYQRQDEFMMHESAVISSAFSRDGEFLATGSHGGQVKVWKLSSGACLRSFTAAHSMGVTSICFSRDKSQILTTSFDQTARVHGLKSGKTLKEFRGHSSFVNAGLITEDGLSVATASSDGTVKIWSAATAECLISFTPGYLAGQVLKDVTVISMQLMPGSPDRLFVCTKGGSAYIVSLQGSVLSCMSSGGGGFLCAALSARGAFAYCAADDGIVYAFDTRYCDVYYSFSRATRTRLLP